MEYLTWVGPRLITEYEVPFSKPGLEQITEYRQRSDGVCFYQTWKSYQGCPEFVWDKFLKEETTVRPVSRAEFEIFVEGRVKRSNGKVTVTNEPS